MRVKRDRKNRCFSYVTAILLATMIIIPGSALAADDYPTVLLTDSSNTEAVVVFSRAMDCSSLTGDAVTLTVHLPGIGHGTVSGKLECKGSVSKFETASPMVPGLNYTVTVDKGARDILGNPMQALYESEPGSISSTDR